MRIGSAVAAILRRSISVDTRVITWEDIADEDDSITRTNINSFEWSNDVAQTPEAAAWLREGWRFDSRNERAESATFVRDRVR